MQWLAMLVRDTGVPASRHLGIKDEVAALDFDFAVSFRLFQLRQDEQKALSKRIAYEVSKMWNGEQDDDSILDAKELHPLIAGDRWADENTLLS